MRWGVAALTLLLTACWQGKPMGKEWTMESLMEYATATVTAKTPAEQIPCHPTTAEPFKACFAIRGPVGQVSTPLDQVFGEDLHQLGAWQFVGETGSVMYETRAGQRLELGLTYSAKNEYSSFLEQLPEEADGILFVVVDTSQFQN